MILVFTSQTDTAQLHPHGTAAGGRFRLDRQVTTARHQEQPAFRPGVLERRAQQCAASKAQLPMWARRCPSAR